MTFEKLNLITSLLEGLNAMGYTKPTPIQEQAIPPILASKDIVAVAQTGTGKTAAYLLPILQNVLNKEHDHINTLILVPTRELALQVDQQIEGFSYFTGVSSIPVYGGGDGVVWEQQKKALQSKADIVVATPGRLISHLASGIFKFDHLCHVVLDEADRMLDMGFHEDIMKIISHTPKTRQTLLFSATMPQKIKKLAGTILKNPVEIAIAISKPVDKIVQQAYLVYDDQKVRLLTHLLEKKDYASVIIFASTKSNVKKLDRVLRKNGIKVKAFHSDLEQPERERILGEFKGRKLPVLVGTDILSRGIDVEGIDLVVNFDVPSDPEDYIHRIGRTARADRTGVAVTFINLVDQRKSYTIEKLIEKEIPKIDLPIGFDTGPLYTPQAGKNAPPKRDFKRKIYSKGRS